MAWVSNERDVLVEFSMKFALFDLPKSSGTDQTDDTDSTQDNPTDTMERQQSNTPTLFIEPQLYFTKLSHSSASNIFIF